MPFNVQMVHEAASHAENSCCRVSCLRANTACMQDFKMSHQILLIFADFDLWPLTWGIQLGIFSVCLEHPPGVAIVYTISSYRVHPE